MTYIQAFRDRYAAYIFADTAVTTNLPPAEVSQFTSFGQHRVESQNRYVFEGALKIYNFGRAAVAFANDVQNGQLIVNSIAKLLQQKYSPRDAFRSAIASHTPFSCRQTAVQMVMVIPETPSPAVVAFNAEWKEEFYELPIGIGVLFGTIGPSNQQVWREGWETLRHGFKLPGGPPHFLVGGIGMLQGFLLRDILLDKHGVGGTFCGVCVTPDQIIWNPDTLYLVQKWRDANHIEHQKTKWVASIVRDNVVVVESSFSKVRSVLGNEVSSGLSSKEWATKWDARIDNLLAKRFEFIVILDLIEDRVTIAEMRGRLNNGWIRLNRIGNGFSIDLHEAAHREINRQLPNPSFNKKPIQLCWFPYVGKPG